MRIRFLVVAFFFSSLLTGAVKSAPAPDISPTPSEVVSMLVDIAALTDYSRFNVVSKILRTELSVVKEEGDVVSIGIEPPSPWLTSIAFNLWEGGPKVLGQQTLTIKLNTKDVCVAPDDTLPAVKVDGGGLQTIRSMYNINGSFTAKVAPAPQSTIRYSFWMGCLYEARLLIR